MSLVSKFKGLDRCPSVGLNPCCNGCLLWDDNSTDFKRGLFCLNPCCNGCLLWEAILRHQVRRTWVLILVVMDVSCENIWVTQHFKVMASLNPCCNGCLLWVVFLQRNKKTRSLNPCCNGCLLWGMNSGGIKRVNTGLNPCCNGCLLWVQIAQYGTIFIVLILVVMDVSCELTLCNNA